MSMTQQHRRVEDKLPKGMIDILTSELMEQISPPIRFVSLG